MTIETGRTTIRQLRATSSDRDPFAYQLRLGSMLSSADLHPPGVPASAIICVRTLHAPPLSAQTLRYGGGRPPLWWEERVRTLIKHALQQASHPLHDTVPPNCEAVIFADRAELLACLASDWCAGDTSYRWWWQSLFRAGTIERFLIPAWLETPEYIPSALLHLASARKATAFVRRLPINDVRTLLHSIICSFALPQLQTVLATAFASQPFSKASLLQEHEHVPAPSETSKTTATTDTTDTTATTATIDTSEIAETTETSTPTAITETLETTATIVTIETLETTATIVTTDTIDTSEIPETSGTTDASGTTNTIATTATMDTTATTNTLAPINLPDGYSQASVGADLSRPSPMYRAVPLANPSSPIIDEQPSKATPLFQSPWLPWVPESTEHDLSPEQQALLGIGLMLTRSPATVRTASFAQSIYHWYGTDQHSTSPYPTPTNTPTDLPIPHPRVPVKGTP
ncbi:MAG: hypothetical protein ABI396_00600 [Ktedonobacteraceae bacterium]